MLSRFSTIASRPRQTLAALAIALLAVGVAVGSSANFTATLAQPTNTFSSGVLSLGGTNTAIFGATNLKPGDSRTGIVDIQNTGTVNADVALRAANPTGDVALLAVLDIVIKDCGQYLSATAPSCDPGDPDVYTGDLFPGIPSNPAFAIGVGQYSADTTVPKTEASHEKHRYQFTVTMPSSVDNTYQNKSATLDFVWDAVS